MARPVLSPGLARGRSLDDLDRALIDAAADRLAAGLHWGCPDLARAVGTTKQTATARVNRMRRLGRWPHAQTPPDPISPPPTRLPLTPLDERRRLLAESHLDMARAAARRFHRLGDDAESEAVWIVVRLAAWWGLDEAGFAEAVIDRLRNVKLKAWVARRLIRPGVGMPSPRVESLTRPDGRMRDVVDERTIPREEWDGPMLYGVTVTQTPGRIMYARFDASLVDDPAEAVKFSTIADAMVWRLSHLHTSCLRLSAVVKVCEGNEFDRSSVVLDRTKSIDVGGPAPTNGTVPKHAEARP